MGPKVKSAIKFWLFIPIAMAGANLGFMLGLGPMPALFFGSFVYCAFYTLLWPSVFMGEILPPERRRVTRIGMFIFVGFFFGLALLLDWAQNYREAKRQRDDNGVSEAVGLAVPPGR